jgi:hypothetical protein
MSELFDAVDALVASRSPLPPPTERKRLRSACASISCSTPHSSAKNCRPAAFSSICCRWG